MKPTTFQDWARAPRSPRIGVEFEYSISVGETFCRIAITNRAGMRTVVFAEDAPMDFPGGWRLFVASALRDLRATRMPVLT